VRLIADLHVHSRFSRATSRDLDFVALHRSALTKGIGLVGTGDFTHPGWMTEIEEQLVPAEEGWFKLRPDLQRVAEASIPAACRGQVRFVLEVEISNIYKKGDRTRKNHNLVFVPNIEAAKRLSQRLAAVGNLASDGRPILGLDARDLLEITLETDRSAFLVPAHIWTPWFSMLGSRSGFDSLKECFRDLSGEVFAVETGLSSDPPMNWRIAELDRMTLISNSDAHSPSKLGREANLFEIEFGYAPLLDALRTGRGFCGTVEFFPEHGKYHLDGHRKCGLRLTPEETRAYGGRCPACGGLITVGVMSRVMDLADPSRPEGFAPSVKTDFRRLVPLADTAAELLGASASNRAVVELCDRMLRTLGPELYILKDAPLEEIEIAGGSAIREAIRRIRCGEMEMEAGYDGEFGNVKVFTEAERLELSGRIGLLRQIPT
jgi:DNA helicase II / ATP-dependent DNA helicase PcrA